MSRVRLYYRREEETAPPHRLNAGHNNAGDAPTMPLAKHFHVHNDVINTWSSIVLVQDSTRTWILISQCLACNDHEVQVLSCIRHRGYMILLTNRLYDMGGTLRVSFAYAKLNQSKGVSSEVNIASKMGWRVSRFSAVATVSTMKARSPLSATIK